MTAGKRGRVARLEAKRPGAAVRVIITRRIMEAGPDGVPVPVRVERREVTARGTR